MSVEVRFRRVRSATLVALSGVAEEDALVRIAEELAAAPDDGLLLVDVGDLLLTDVNAVRAFLAHLFDGRPDGGVVLVCPRMTGRRILRRWGGNDVPILARVDDGIRSRGGWLEPASGLLRRRQLT